MNFVSIEYFYFLSLVLLIKYFLPTKYLKYFLLFSSYFFYSVWDIRFLSLIVISTLTDYFLSLKIFKENKLAIRKRYLSLSLIINLGILFIFKYFDFFVNSFMRFGLFNDGTFNSLNIILPVGISFYTFQTISYTLDVFNSKIEPERDLITFANYVCFFPQLVAGPIERASVLIPRLKNFENENNFDIQNLYLIAQGLVMKAVIADNISIVVESIYKEIENSSSSYLLIGAICFSIQIYCDFAGYSRIARGSAGLLGVKLSTNFNSPYASKNIQEFWSRWHITLSSWFRDYLYIPLGGNRKKVIRNIFNLLLTMLIAGLWHGASWNFVIWGFLYGIILSLRYTKQIIGINYKDLFVIFLLLIGTYKIFYEPHTSNYFETYQVELTENSIYSKLNFPADGRCMNSLNSLGNFDDKNINYKIEKIDSSFKCHNRIMGVNSEILDSNKELVFVVGNNELIPTQITRENLFVFAMIVILIQRKFQFKLIKIFSTFVLTTILWIPFRVKGFENIKTFFTSLMSNNSVILNPPTEHWTRLLNIENGNYLGLYSSKFIFPILILFLIEFVDIYFKNNKLLKKKNLTNFIISSYVVLFILFAAREYSPFIYFQF